MEKPNQIEKKLSRSQLRRRDDILQAALNIFERKGFETAKMEDIAVDAGVAKGTLYLYFDTKSALLEGVIKSAIMPTLQQIGDAARMHHGTARDLLIQQMKIAAARMASNEMKLLLRLMISGGSKQHSIIDFYFKNVVQKGLEHFKATLDYGVETGEFRQEVKNLDPLVLVGSPVYTAVWNILFEDIDPINAQELVEDHVEIVLSGILKSP